MHMRLDNFLYGVGLFGAALGVLYAVDAIWVHETGRLILPFSDRYISRDTMIERIGVGILLTLLCWGAGASARFLVQRSGRRQRLAK